MAKGKSGGGITSRNNVRPPSRPGMPARGINPGHVAQHGLALGNKAMNDPKRLNPVEPKSTRNPHSVKLGNEVAKNVGGGGPGAGRVVMGSGTQGQHGGVAGSVKPAGRDILSEFGSESKPGLGGRR